VTFEEKKLIGNELLSKLLDPPHEHEPALVQCVYILFTETTDKIIFTTSVPLKTQQFIKTVTKIVAEAPFFSWT
jgi:hypothetical protein